tara:strand:+ start:1940 stop:2218 length:279 start_codon:yes stop_codon:yes gene_type:complete
MNNNTPQQGKPWKVVGFFDAYDEADQKRKELLFQWSNLENPDSMQVKVRRKNSSKNFVVKIRSNPKFDLPPSKKEKNNGKRKSRNSSRRNPS